MSIDIAEPRPCPERSDGMKEELEAKPDKKKTVRFAPTCSMRLYQNGPRKSERMNLWYQPYEYEMFRMQIKSIALDLQLDRWDKTVLKLLEETTTLGIEHFVNKKRMELKQRRRSNAAVAVLGEQRVCRDSETTHATNSDVFIAYHYVSEMCQAEAHLHAISLFEDIECSQRGDSCKFATPTTTTSVCTGRH